MVSPPRQTPPQQTPLGRHPQADTPLLGRHPLGQTPPGQTMGYGQQAGSTHPTGMHSCLIIVRSLCKRDLAIHFLTIPFG